MMKKEIVFTTIDFNEKENAMSYLKIKNGQVPDLTSILYEEQETEATIVGAVYEKCTFDNPAFNGDVEKYTLYLITDEGRVYRTRTAAFISTLLEYTAIVGKPVGNGFKWFNGDVVLTMTCDTFKENTFPILILAKE